MTVGAELAGDFRREQIGRGAHHHQRDRPQQILGAERGEQPRLAVGGDVASDVDSDERQPVRPANSTTGRTSAGRYSRTAFSSAASKNPFRAFWTRMLGKLGLVASKPDLMARLNARLRTANSY